MRFWIILQIGVMDGRSNDELKLDAEATGCIGCIIKAIGSSCKQGNGQSEGASEGPSRHGILLVRYYYSRQIQDRDVSAHFCSICLGIEVGQSKY